MDTKLIELALRKIRESDGVFLARLSQEDRDFLVRLLAHRIDLQGEEVARAGFVHESLVALGTSVEVLDYPNTPIPLAHE